MTERYIHIRNWDRFQHPDTTRRKDSGAAIPWVKDYTGQLHDDEYLELGFADRGLLQSLRLQYGATRGRGITDTTTNLYRLFGQRVFRSQLERLNHAGFIEFSASRTLARGAHDASPEVETEREGEKSSKESTSGLAKHGATVENEGHEPAPAVTSLDDFKARALRVQARVEQARRSG